MTAVRMPDAVRALYTRFRHIFAEVTKFGLVGAANFFVDIAIYNLCASVFGLGPLTSKTISATIATTSAFFGNRYWTWRHRPRTNLAREYVMYFLMNAIGLAIALACLGFSYYVLGEYWPGIFKTPLANNISGNIIGNVLGTLFRFLAYRRWVFAGSPKGVDDDALHADPAGAAADPNPPTEPR